MIVNINKYKNDKSNPSLLQKLVDICKEKGGGSILIPAGEIIISNPISLYSNISIHIEEGAKIISNSSNSNPLQRPFIFAENAHNISINGTGTIDGNGKNFIIEKLPHIYKCIRERQHTIQFKNCKNIRLKNFSIHDSQHYSIHLFKCENALINNLNIFNDLKMPNTDGIDPDSSKNIIISNCYIESGDDSICLKTNSINPEDSCDSIIINNCVLKSSSCAIKFGSESNTDIKNVVISNCIIKDSNRGIGFQLRDSGNFKNIIVSDCIINTKKFHNDWWGKAEPIYITAIPRNNNTNVGSISNINIKRIICIAENGIYLEGIKSKNINDISLEDISLEIKDSKDFPAQEFDRRPCEKNEIIKTPLSAVRTENIKSISLKNFSIKWNTHKKHKNILSKNSSFKKKEILEFREQ